MSLESDGGMIYWHEKPEELGEKPVPVPLFPQQNPHGLNRARTLASAVKGRRLTTWAMTRPFFSVSELQWLDLPTEFHKIYKFVEKLIGGQTHTQNGDIISFPFSNSRGTQIVGRAPSGSAVNPLGNASSSYERHLFWTTYGRKIKYSYMFS
jgi:hypothetical protein